MNSGQGNPLVVELTLESLADPVRGSIRPRDGGASAPFTGWIGLVAAVEALAAEPAAGRPASREQPGLASA